MKSHTLAKALKQLSTILLDGPNVELRDLRLNGLNAMPDIQPEKMAVSLDVLVSLARIDKQRWRELIKEHGFPIQIRSRDSSRDILGRVLKHLDSDPEALRRLKQRSGSRVDPAPELLNAFATLLRRSD